MVGVVSSLLFSFAVGCDQRLQGNAYMELMASGLFN